MKKLVFALVLCLCAGSLSVAMPSRAQFALAEEQDDEAKEQAKQEEEEAARKKAEEEEAARKQAEEEAARKKADEEAAQKKAEEEAARKKAEEEEAARKQAEEEAARKQAEEEAARKEAEEEAARKQAEEEAARKEAEKEAAEKAESEKKAEDKKKAEGKKAEKNAEKPLEYAVDLAGNGQFLLSELLVAAKADFAVRDVKSVEPEDEEVLKLLAWTPDEQDKDDYLFTVLKGFKEARLIVSTKKDSCVLVLANGAEYVAPVVEQEEAPAPAEIEKQTEVENEADEATEAEAASESEIVPEEENVEPMDETVTEELPAEALTATEAQPTNEGADDAQAADESSPAADEGTQDEAAGEDAQAPEEAATVPEDAEAWFLRDDAPVWGTLAEVAGQLTGGETVYIRSSAKLLVDGAPLKTLSAVAFAADSSAFGSGYVVRISMDNPDATQEPRLLEASALSELGEYASLYFWVEKDEASASGEDGQDGPVITVVATDYREAAWSAVAPQFELSGIQEDNTTWSYSALIYNERFVPISGSTYVPTEQGQYALRFAMLDELGDIKALSDQYTLWLDWTPPEKVSIEVDEEESYTLNITAKDGVSGVEAVSLNNGKLWHLLEDGETYTYTGKDEKTFEAGTIQVRDVAGNIYYSEEDYTVEEVESDEDEDEDADDDGGSIGGGGGGGSGSGAKALSHASGDGEEGSEYDALLLEIPDEAMEQLTVGGEVMDLTLTLEAADGPEAPVGDNQPFTADLRQWNGDDTAPDTLVLNAELDANLGDEFTYEWRFNGEVYRLLANSGIKYVALKVGDDVTAFPTEGFTGGTRYTELKMQGVSTRKFDYTMSMRINRDPDHVFATSENDFSQDCELSIRAAVEDTNYELSSSPKSIMYFYNVYLGPEAMMDQPFGEYQEEQ